MPFYFSNLILQFANLKKQKIVLSYFMKEEQNNIEMRIFLKLK